MIQTRTERLQYARSDLGQADPPTVARTARVIPESVAIAKVSRRQEANE